MALFCVSTPSFSQGSNHQQGFIARLQFAAFSMWEMCVKSYLAFLSYMSEVVNAKLRK